jgi:hypothetical protein
VALLGGDDQAIGQRDIQVAADRRGCEPESRSELGRGGRPQLEQELNHPLAGAPVSGGRFGRLLNRTSGFHNNIIA